MMFPRQPSVHPLIVTALLAGSLLAGNDPNAGQTTPDSPPPSLARSFTVLPGFGIEGVYRVPPEQGSWVAMTVDPQGRLISSDQFGKLYRVTLPRPDEPVKVEPLKIELGSAQGLLHAFDSLYVVVNRRRTGTNQPGSGLYRARDTTGDDQYDQIVRLRAFDGDGERGPHAVVLGPDQQSLFVLAGNATALPDPESSRIPGTWRDDSLLAQFSSDDRTRQPNRPGGWICRTDPDGQIFEWIATGLCNPYDLAFNVEGELFTFDADTERDLHTSWYRPTRVLHVTSGADFGWRTGRNQWPETYLDTLPAVIQVGRGAPTGVTFGHGARFPARYQRALYLADWGHGRIHAVHLEPRGSSYTGRIESFLTGTPMAITALLIHPHDGMLYFIVGGRGTSSALYRIAYHGSESVATVSPRMPVGGGARAERHRLESFHGRTDPEAVSFSWPYLDHPDRHIRYAARVAIEHQPTVAWQELALTDPRPRGRIAALTALARHGDSRHQPYLFEALTRIPIDPLTPADRVDLVRLYTLACLRLGHVAPANRIAALRHLDGLYPAESFSLNRELALLLVYLRAPNVLERTLALLDQAITLEEQIHYLLCLHALNQDDWTLPQLMEFFDHLNHTAANPAPPSFTDAISRIRSVTLNQLSAPSQKALRNRLNEPPTVHPLDRLKARPVSGEWTVTTLLPAAGVGQRGRDPHRGREVYGKALCSHCHRFAGVGGFMGPDLHGVGRRLDTRGLLQAMLEPDRTVLAPYNAVQVTTTDGQTNVGRITNMNQQHILLLTDLLVPSDLLSIRHEDIADIVPSPASMMPAGLLHPFTKEDILDLLAYLRTPQLIP